MITIQDAKGALERVTGLGRPTKKQLGSAVRPRKAHGFKFTDDGIIPNNATLSLIVYRTPVRLAGDFDPAALFEELFEANGWADGWRDGIYDFTHYHSRTHEVLGIARGSAKVRFGGAEGRLLFVKAGDVVVIPAGVSHRRMTPIGDLLVVGAYPAVGKYNEYRESRDEHDRALPEVAHVPLPKKDPVYGAGGALLEIWKNPRHQPK
jgi:uncharacterized protein YjlB